MQYPFRNDCCCQNQTDHFLMKQQINERDTFTYPGEVLNHNVQVHIFCFKYIRADPVGSVN